MMSKLEAINKLEQLKELPVLPQAIIKVHEFINNPIPGQSNVVDIILKDLGLTAKILCAVNSLGTMGINQPVTTLSHAVLILGYKNLGNMLGGQSIQQLIADLDEVKYYPIAKIWGHALSCATCCREIAQKINHTLPEEVFIGGLLHDIGRIILYQIYSDQYVDFIKEIKDNRTSLKLERERFGLTNKEAGQIWAKKWLIPQTYIQLMGEDYEVSESIQTASEQTVNIVRFAHVLLHEFNSGNSIDLGKIKDRAKSILPELSSDALENIVQFLPKEFEKIKRYVTLDARDLLKVTQLIKDANLTLEKINISYEQVNNELQKKVSLLTLMQEISQIIMSSINVHEMFQLILEKIYRGLIFDRAFMLKVDHAFGRLIGEIGCGRKAEEIIKSLVLPFGGKDVFTQTISQQRPIIFSEENKTPSEVFTKLGTKALLIVPILVNKIVDRILLLDNSISQRRIFQEEIENATFFASQIGLAVIKANQIGSDGGKEVDHVFYDSVQQINIQVNGILRQIQKEIAQLKEKKIIDFNSDFVRIESHLVQVSEIIGDLRLQVEKQK